MGNQTSGTPKKMDINYAHGIYGHLSAAALRSTLKTINVEATGSLLACEGCALAKAKAKGVPKLTTTMATYAGERIYADISGPYWCLFVDQYSGKLWSFFVNTKSALARVADELSLP